MSAFKHETKQETEHETKQGTEQEAMINAIQEQQAHWMTFASKAMENSMKLVELNMRMAKESIDESSASIQQLLTAKAPDKVLKLNSDLMQAKLNRIMSYVNEVNTLTSGTLSSVPNAQFQDAFDKITKSLQGAQSASPHNNQQPFDFMWSAFGDASKGYGEWMDASKKIVEAVEHNLVVNPATKSKPASSKKRVHH